MMPIHFGPGDAPLYGGFHPGSEPRKRRGALILAPWGWEALRAHRTLYQLADRLAGSGHDTLRFDYSCSGDSAGDPRDVSAHRWVEDAEEALDELLAMSGTKRATVIGLRLGGLMAMSLAERRPRQVDRLVLWERARSGAEFLDFAADAPEAEQGAFPVTDRFREEILEVGGDALAGFPGRILSISNEGLALATPQARSLLEVSPPDESPVCWTQDRDHGAGAVPVALLTHIVEWLDD